MRESLILVNIRQEATTEVKEKVANQTELVGNLTYEIEFVVSLQASLPVENIITPISTPWNFYSKTTHQDEVEFQQDEVEFPQDDVECQQDDVH